MTIGTVSLAGRSVWLCRDILVRRHHLGEDQLRSARLVQENILRACCHIYLTLILHGGSLRGRRENSVSQLSVASEELHGEAERMSLQLRSYCLRGLVSCVTFCPRLRSEYFQFTSLLIVNTIAMSQYLGIFHTLMWNSQSGSLGVKPTWWPVWDTCANANLCILQ